ncbi:MAG: tRNA pseudouridine(38-40) synthase TruA [Christensenellaceae bacterium]|jgi:tRNA pseudouridine38-40 synthase|nr:tRNA pseudouridine(38-40) synthase TruA [Christensenellaceae bacterium]
MKNIQLILEYLGTNYNGYQKQKNGKSVQSELERAIKEALDETPVIYASGRTDAGVHAKGQVVNFVTDTTIPSDKIAVKLNMYLPKDISIIESREVSKDFNARFWAVAKEYQYRICKSEHMSIFEKDRAMHYPYKLDMDKLKEAAGKLVGEHDFGGFQASKSDLKGDSIRKIIRADFEEKDHGILIFKIRGTGFLYNMVRIIVGTLLDIGSGKKDMGIIDKIFETKDRTLAGKTVPACGLYLKRVYYNNGEAKTLDENSYSYQRAKLYYKHTVEGTVFKKARGIIVDGNEIVAICEIKPKGKVYFVTGGGVEEGEAPEAAMVREAKEEMNADVKVIKLLYILKERFVKQMFEFKIDCERHTYYYLCCLVGGDLDIIGREEFDGDQFEVARLPKKMVNKLLIPRPVQKAFFRNEKIREKRRNKHEPL